MKTNPKMRDLSDLKRRTEAPERLRAQIARDAAATAPLDPYAHHAIEHGVVRVVNPKTKALETRPAVTCSCGRLSEAATTEYEITLAIRVHVLEISLVRLARAAGIDLDTAPGPLERAKGGDPSAVASLEMRDEILRGKVAANAPLNQADVDEIVHGTGSLPPQGILDGQDHVEPLAGRFAGASVGLMIEQPDSTAEFVVRADALGFDAPALLDQADELAETSELTIDQARERVLSDAMRSGLGPRIGQGTGEQHEGIDVELGETGTLETTDDDPDTAPVEGSLWVCKACEGRNELEATTCASCTAEIPENPDYVLPLDPTIAHAMLGREHPLVRAELGIRDTNPDQRPPAWDEEQITATGGTAPDTDPDA